MVDCPDGRLAIRHKSVDLPDSTFDKLRNVTHVAMVDNKRLSAAPEIIREEQQHRPMLRSQHAPRRRG